MGPNVPHLQFFCRHEREPEIAREDAGSMNQFPSGSEQYDGISTILEDSQVVE
jgi:hypothetical protein